MSKCVAEAYGGTHCIGRCIDPRDCSATPMQDEEHLLNLCSRSVQRLHEIARFDMIPQSLVRGEADVLEKWIVELKLLHRSKPA